MLRVTDCRPYAGIIVVAAVIAASVPSPGDAVPLSVGADVSGLCQLTYIDCWVIDVGEEGCNICYDDLGSQCQTKRTRKTCSCWGPCTIEEECYKCASCIDPCGGTKVFGCESHTDCKEGCLTGDCLHDYRYAQMSGTTADCNCDD